MGYPCQLITEKRMSVREGKRIYIVYHSSFQIKRQIYIVYIFPDLAEERKEKREK